MTTETNTAPLTDKEAQKIFRDAYSDIHKSQGKIENAYELPSYEKEDEPAVVVPEAKIPPSTPAPTPTPAAVPAEQPAAPQAAAPATEAPASAQKTIEDIIKELPGEAQTFISKVIAERDLADQRYRTTSGRLHKTRQEYLDRQREIAELRTRVTTPQPSAVEEQAKIDHAKSLEEWQAVIQAEPTLAKAVDALTDAKVGAVKDQLTQLQTQLSSREAAQSETQRELNKQQEWDRLASTVPNVQDVLTSREYKHWITNVAPPAIQRMAEESIDHRDALFVLASYHPYAVALSEQINRQNNPAAASAPVAQPVAPTAPTRADEIANQRNSKPVTPVSSSVPPINVSAGGGELNMKDQSSIEAYFQQAYEKAKKR